MKHVTAILRICAFIILFFLACAGIGGMIGGGIAMGEEGVLLGLLIFGGSLITSASSIYAIGLLIHG